MVKKKTEFRVPNKSAEQIRVTLNRDLGEKFTYRSPYDKKSTYFNFKDVKTKNKVCKKLKGYLMGNWNKKLRNSIKC